MYYQNSGATMASLRTAPQLRRSPALVRICWYWLCRSLRRTGAAAPESRSHKSPLTEELLPIFARMRCPFSIAHMGMFRAQAGPNQPGFAKLLDLLRHGEGRAWVKLDRRLPHGDRAGLRRCGADGACADRGGARPADLGQRLSASLVRRHRSARCSCSTCWPTGRRRNLRGSGFSSTIRLRCLDFEHRYL